MMQVNIKRCLSLILAMVLTFSLLPVSALAEEPAETVAMETTSLTEATEAPTEALEETTSAAEETEPDIPETTVPFVAVEEAAPVMATSKTTALETVQAEINRILDYYDISLSMTTEEIVSTVDSMETMTYREALYEIMELDETEEMQSLTDAEFQILEEENEVFFVFAQALNDRYVQDDSISLLGSDSTTAMNGEVSISASDAGLGTPKISVDGSSITVSLSGITRYSDYTTNVTITNNSTDKVLSFQYVTDGNANGDDGSIDVLNLMPGASADAIALRVTGRNTAYLNITITKWETVQATAKIKFIYDTADVTVDGVSVGGSGTEKSISSTNGATINATGTNFVGWINTEDNSIISSTASFKLTPPEDMTIKPIYGPTARFEIDKTYLFEDFSSAVTFATANGKSTIALANNGTLTGSITVPAGITLLIPYDDARTLCTTTPYVNKDNSYKKPSAYRTLTMSAGSSIIVNGALSLSGEACTKMGSNSCPMGPLGFITMASNSNITINNGGKLYAWGYITGSGTVTVESGGITYENFQLKDWRGGDGASSMINNKQKVFPVSQYYVQNVEVPMEFKQGASAKGYLVIVASSMMQSAEVPFIGTGSMFVVGGTSLVKDYIESTDRLHVDINGDLSMSSLQISLDSYNMDSNKYTLPITNNITVNINSGTTTISQDMAILPGAEITVAENAKLVLSSGKSVYVYDMDTWNGYVYNNLNYKPLTYANKGTPATRAALVDAKITVNGTLDASGGYLYTSSGGANICSEGSGIAIITPGTSTVTYQATQKAVTESILGYEYTRQEITYHEIPITPAKLLNNDGSYTETATYGAGTYKYINGKWYKVVNIVASNLAVNDGLDMWFYVKYEDVAGITGKYNAVVTKYFADDRTPNPIIETISGSEWKAYDGNEDGTPEYYRFCFSDISAKEMTDQLQAIVLHQADSVQVSNTYEQTVQNYAITMLDYYKEQNDDSQKTEYLRSALMDMLEYGTAAQEQFKYNQSVPANIAPSNIATLENHSSYISTTDPSCTSQKDSDNLAGVTISATNKLLYTFYFNVADPTDMYAVVTYTHHNDETPTEYTVTYDKFYKRSEGLYGVDVPGLSIVDGFSLLDCKLYNSSGEQIGWGQDSVAGYAERNKSKGDIYMAMMRFVHSALTYFDCKELAA